MNAHAPISCFENIVFVDFPARPSLPANDSVLARKPGRKRREPTLSAARLDDELFDRIADGDVDAAVKLFEIHEGRLTTIAQAIMEDEVEAEDVVAASLDEACRGWPPERGEVARSLDRLVRRNARSRRRALAGLEEPRLRRRRKEVTRAAR